MNKVVVNIVIIKKFNDIIEIKMFAKLVYLKKPLVTTLFATSKTNLA